MTTSSLQQARFLDLAGILLGSQTRVLGRRWCRRLLTWFKPATAFTLRIASGDLRGWRIATSRSCADAMWIGNYEGKRRDLIRPLIERDAVVFDVGAHIGFFAMWFASLVGPRGRVVAFEPCSQNLPLLNLNVALNLPDTASVQVVPAAATNACGTLPLHTSGGVSSMSRLDGLPLAGADHLMQTEMVSTMTLDSFAAQTGFRPTHIKIDVEGAELDVLEGAQQLLSETRPLVFCEAHFGIVDLRPLAALLAAVDYYAVDLNNRPIDERELAKRDRFEWLLLAPQEKATVAAGRNAGFHPA